MITYRVGNPPSVEQVIHLLHASTLAQRRPVDDPSIIADMLTHASLIVTAWDDSRLVGLARTLTDFSYVGYLSDLAVDVAHQRQGIGERLIELTRQQMGPRSMLVLLAAPAATAYYPRIGFNPHPSAWILRHDQPLGSPANP
jgi:GNAT superfamily N-acetyltransferase